jgi:glucokinase
MEYILSADVGGTNSRFGCFEWGGGGHLRLVEKAWLKTGGAASFFELLSQLEQQGFKVPLSDYRYIAVAVPGPVGAGDRIEMANVSWTIDPREIRDRLGAARVHLVNDFVAQVYGCRTEAVREAMVIQGGQADETGPLAVVGAGTGLGHCTLMPDGAGHYLAVPSEAGHTPFPFLNRSEWDYGVYLTKAYGTSYAYGDMVVSGPGLSSLHEFLTGERLSPRVVAQEVSGDSQTLAWFARFYARACRTYALTVLPRAGLYITGGVAAQNPHLIDNEIFMAEFADSVKYRSLLLSLPLRLNTNEESGLWGAAYLAASHRPIRQSKGLGQTG